MTKEAPDGWELFIRRNNILGDITDERVRQIDLWGLQGHDSFARDIVLEPRSIVRYLLALRRYHVPTAVDARSLCQMEDRYEGDSSWVAILTEEFAEAVEAAAMDDVAGLRTELVQTAAVIVAWLEQIDKEAREASA